jgi:hypothetical protein
MKTIKLSLTLAPVLLVSLIFSAPTYAATSVVHDPAGDSRSSSPYVDVVQARIIEQQGRGTLLFIMQLAGPIPEEPSESVLIWVFHLDTNPATSPGGLYNEYIVRVLWSNGAFTGQVVNRTGAPTLVFTPVTFSIDGSTVKAFVPLDTLGNPSSFGWNAATRPSPPAAYLDIAPDGCDPSSVPCGLATWSQESGA